MSNFLLRCYFFNKNKFGGNILSEEFRIIEVENSQVRVNVGFRVKTMEDLHVIAREFRQSIIFKMKRYYFVRDGRYSDYRFYYEEPKK